MRTSLRPLALLPLTLLAVSVLAPAQHRASLSSPVLRRSGDDVILVCRALNLDPSRQYRLGFGVAEGSLEIDLELVRGTRRIGGDPASFQQGYTSNWWGVNELHSFGIVFAGGPEVSLTARLKKDHARSFDRVFLFIAREYAPGTWYLEDGVELLRKHW